MRPILLAILAATSCSSAWATERREAIDALIAESAARADVPVSLVKNVVQRESRYDPAAVHAGCYGLMQITYRTARRMGYGGKPDGLLDPAINLRFAVPYLARAYRLAKGNEARTMRLYRAGF